MQPLRGLSLIAIAIILLSSVNEVRATMKVPAADWISSIQHSIVHSEYQFFRSRTDGVWRASNRTHHFRIRFDRDEVSLRPWSRDGSWLLGVSIASIDSVPRSEAWIAGGALNLRDDTVLQHWRNKETGLSGTLTRLGSDKTPIKLNLRTDMRLIASETQRELSLYRHGKRVLKLTVQPNNVSVSVTPTRRGYSVALSPADALQDTTASATVVRFAAASTAGPTVGVSATPDKVVAPGQRGVGFGLAVAAAGDVNGDGYSDVVVGAPDYDADFENGGRAFLFLGSESGLQTVPAWFFDGQAAGANLGNAVSSAGDVNRDGYGDLIVGALDDGSGEEGRAFIFLGSESGPDDDPDWFGTSRFTDADYGRSVAALGDVNGDGYDDVAVGATFFGAEKEGAVFVYHGSPTGVAASNADIILVGQARSRFGEAIASAGDVNGDGYHDLAVVAPGLEIANNQSEGAIFLFCGSNLGIKALPCAEIQGTTNDENLGAVVAGVGDTNGDGLSDLIIGRPHVQNDAGKVQLYLGSDGPSPLITESAWSVTGQASGALMGSSVASAGDVNGDGLADIAVGAPGDPNAAANVESGAFIYAGSRDVQDIQPFWTAFQPVELQFGVAIATAGDVDNDGRSDLLVGASEFEDEGRAFLYRGGAGLPDRTPQVIVEPRRFDAVLDFAGDLNGDGWGDFVSGATGFGLVRVYFGSSEGVNAVREVAVEGSSNGFGSSAAGVGDVNGDGFDDLLVGDPNYEPQTVKGAVFLCYGPYLQCELLDRGGDRTARYGAAIARAGDINGDGYADFSVVAKPIQDPGRTFILLGGPAGPTVPSIVSNFGQAIGYGGDVNGDGFSDVVAGDPNYEDGGTAELYLGSASGLSMGPVWASRGDPDGARVGYAVGSVGDINGDGFGDAYTLAVDFGHRAELSVYLGAEGGLSVTPAWSRVSQVPSSVVVDLAQTVSTGGDLNGDGYSDLLVASLLPPSDVSAHLGSPTGLTDHAVWTIATSGPLGAAVTSAGDINGDGASDFVISSPDLGMSSQLMVHHGNGGLGLSRGLKQLNSNGQQLSQFGISDSPRGVRLNLGLRSPGTDRGLSAEVQIIPVGRSFNDPAALTTTSGRAGGSTAEARFNNLEPGVAYSWRARIVAKDPQFPSSPWRTMQGTAPTESKFRTPGPLRQSELVPVGPPLNETIYPDTPSLFFSWRRGGGDEFQVEWSANPEFEDRVVVSTPIPANTRGDIQSLQPRSQRWVDVLRLGRAPDFREAPIFWRVVRTRPQPQVSEFKVIRMAASQAATIVAPAVDSIFFPAQPPELAWDANHNAEYRVVFSTSESIAPPQISSGEGFEIQDSTWEVPESLWAEIVNLSRANDGQVYFVIFARDQIGRTTWSEPRRIRIAG